MAMAMPSSKQILVVFFLAIVATMTMVSPVDGISGTATFYTPPYIPSACFGNNQQGTTMIAAASEVFWGGGAACGDQYEVTCTGATNKGVTHPCTGQSVTVEIVDLCPSPACRGTVDLSQEAFAVIADPNAGKIDIEYHKV